MSLLDQLIGIVAPHDCLGCGSEAGLVCPGCLSKLPAIPNRCYRCRKITVNNDTCQSCRHSSKLNRVFIATIYNGVSKDLVWQLKFAGAQAAARIMTERMSLLVKDEKTETIIIPVPTATGRARRRGYDQAKLLARELSRRTRLPYYDCLSRSGQLHQHGNSRQDRLRQLARAFRVKRPIPAKIGRVILVDDVITTGSTLEAAATVLKAAGARRIEAVVFAQP